MAFNGACLKQLRIRKGESLQQIASAVSVSKAHVWDLETGKSANPSVELLLRLAGHFNVSIAYLVGEDPNATDEEAELVAMFRNLKSLDLEDREMINVVMQQMRERKKKAQDDAD